MNRYIKSLNQELVIHKIIDGNTSRLDDFLDLFTTLFPQYRYRSETLTETAQAQANANPKFIEHQWLIDINNVPAAMTTFKFAPQRNIGIGVHLAIQPEFRNYTYGNFTRLSEIIIQETREQFVIDAQAHGQPIPPGYIIEVVEPKLIKRYQEYGFIPFDVPYFEPTISKKNRAFVNYDPSQDIMEFHPAVIGIIPIRNQKIDPQKPRLLKKAVDAFLLDYYELEESHWVYQKAIESISEKKLPMEEK